MARLTAFLGLMLILSCGTICSSALTPFSLEDKLQELEVRLEAKIEAKNAQLEEKVTQLEAQLELNNELRQDLTLKVIQLEAKNVQLEVKIQDQERIVTSLLEAAELPVSTDSKLFPVKKEISIRSTGKSGIPRTCRELRAVDPSLSSGMHWIDPDGQGVGDDPIYVYCDMTSGSTSVLHDSESSLNVGHCAEAGCYSRSINYNSSMGQIKALMELSTECRQSIRYDCNFAPFELYGVAYSWWNDREGIPQYFWAGSNTDGVHTCQCGIDANCVDPAAKCNCDSLAPLQLVDDGVITDKTVLPISRLNFGRTQLETSSGVHTLGRLVCTGLVTLTGLPKSCKDLWLIGHTLNGFYSVMGSAKMESVYCDFTKLPDDPDFQKWIGYADVKSAPVHFFVARNSSFNTTGTPIPFELEVANEGNAMDLASGIFTAPRPGIYFFSFTGLGNLQSSSWASFSSYLYLNGHIIGSSYVQEAKGPVDQLNPLTLQSTLNLKIDDQVFVMIFGHSSYLFDDSRHFTQFTGFMLEEEIVASL
ncbi:uncharacterized protein LOC124316246 isoform X2 [Daphnia pulicaria]|uniref:uncharacterized protein LOC124316246 isoform X2 n=1 Tax=Daphnia pulicaria TaxID=35523 RepID=UPI001EEBF045|nr:uncharacterized protein LOC124316246 isoform X2 [Daphnia pulicaria]XP_046638030.1 uncharacterized protein LOC124316246 isoform X2 [Daphnia pulicaria]